MSCKGKPAPCGACERCRDLEEADLLTESGHTQNGLHGNHTGGLSQLRQAGRIREYWREDDKRDP